MKFAVSTFIEVMNEPNIWAVELNECKYKMKPDIVRFATIHNDISKPDIIYVDCTLSYIKPEKIIDGVNGGISDYFVQVGYWKIKNPLPIK